MKMMKLRASAIIVKGKNISDDHRWR